MSSAAIVFCSMTLWLCKIASYFHWKLGGVLYQFQLHLLFLSLFYGNFVWNLWTLECMNCLSAEADITECNNQKGQNGVKLVRWSLKIMRNTWELMGCGICAWCSLFRWNSGFFVTCGVVCTNLQGICCFMSLTVEVNKPSISSVKSGSKFVSFNTSAGMCI